MNKQDDKNAVVIIFSFYWVPGVYLLAFTASITRADAHWFDVGSWIIIMALNMTLMLVSAGLILSGKTKQSINYFMEKMK